MRHNRSNTTVYLDQRLGGPETNVIMGYSANNQNERFGMSLSFQRTGTAPVDAADKGYEYKVRCILGSGMATLTPMRTSRPTPPTSTTGGAHRRSFGRHL